MTALLPSITRPMVAGMPAAASALFGACRDAVTRYFARREAIARLREFDDCALRDIGLTRSQIAPAVRGIDAALPDRPWR